MINSLSFVMQTLKHWPWPTGDVNIDQKNNWTELWQRLDKLRNLPDVLFKNWELL